MDLDDALRRRKMTRSFSPSAIAPDVLDRLLGRALRAPSAGFTQGVDFLVFDGPSEVGAFFRAACEADFLADPGAMAGLLSAPVVVLPLADPEAYVDRYAEADKAPSGLAGLGSEQWAVPYWLVDASFATMLLLLGAAAEGVGALFFRLHQDPTPFLAERGVPGSRSAIGAVALGYPATESAGPAGSPARRRRRPAGEVIHRGHW
jgi:nitroreductase